ncbi:PEGA domain-containing protein, partial [Myxococcota bacterium]|nr:PEGA domain-containing protein [Myxococcota bacterium]
MKQISTLFFFLFGLIWIPGTAFAQGTAPRAAGFFYYQGNITSKILKFKDQLSGATAYSTKIQWKPITLELPADNTEELDKAYKIYDEGTDLGKDGKLEEGFAKYKTALALLEKHMYTLTVSKPFPGNKKKYRGLFKRMAKYSFYLGDKETAKLYILRYLAFRFGDKAEKWPKDMRDLWTSVAEPYFAKGKGKLTITTDPPGARIYYKFSDKGPAPLTKKVSSGEVLIMATHAGYKPAIKRVMFDPSKGPMTTKITLEPMLNSPLKYLLPAKLELGHANPGANIVTAVKTLGVDVMVFYYLQAKSEAEVKVTA